MNFDVIFSLSNLAFMLGSLLSVFCVLFLVKKALFKFAEKCWFLLVAYFISLGLTTSLAAAGFSNEGIPQWQIAFWSYFPGHFIWFCYDLSKKKVSR